MTKPLSLLVLSFLTLPGASAEEVGIRAPEGFEVSLYADDELAHDIFSMTIDSEGRVVVAGLGYVKTLHDGDGDGRADSATLFSEIPASGAHGMFFDGPDLICTGDNSLMRLRDENGDGKADGEPQVWAALKHSEHGTNGIVQGPDGWFYVICGNDAGVSEKLAGTSRSPVKQPNCGAVVRFSPDGGKSEIVAHGFRNPYDLGFNSAGHLFTVDADGERDQYLPWYTPNRLFDIAQGMHHGWIQTGWQRSWNRPECFFDNVERLVEVGRGSPTGVIVYRHRQFPKEYRGGVMSCCWTLGRVYHFPLSPSGASYESRREIFLETTGDVGFAPVDLAVGPEGDLFVAIGGRRTRGGVFRVRYAGDDAPLDSRLRGNDGSRGAASAEQAEPPAGDPLGEVLGAPQPLAAWSRARWKPLAVKLGAKAFEKAALDERRPASERLRAVEILVEVFGGLPLASAREIVAGTSPQLTARAAWALSRSYDQVSEAERREIVAELCGSDHPLIARAAWEARGTWPDERDDRAEFRDADNIRRVRAARLHVPSAGGAAPPAKDGEPAAVLAAEWRRHFAGEPLRWERAVHVFLNEESRLWRLEAVRLMQIAIGDVSVEPGRPDVYAGYRPRDEEAAAVKRTHPLTPALAAAFPTGDEEIDRELARLLGMIEPQVDRLPDRLAEQFSAETAVEDDIHYLIVLSRIPGARSSAATHQSAAALAALHHKMAAGEKYPSRNWPARVGETFAELCRRDEKLAGAVIADENFRLPEQSLFGLLCPESLRPAAARTLLKRSATGADARWNSQMVELAAVLPAEESLPVLRARWEEYALREAIALELARHAAPQDRQRLIAGLRSTQPEVIERCAAALRQIGGEAAAEETAVALLALKQVCAEKGQAAPRDALQRLLVAWTGERIEFDEAAAKDDPLSIYRAWQEWFARAHPDAAASLTGFSGASAVAWKKRLADIDWASGDVERGKVAYEKRGCRRCHSEADRLGPDLAGAAGRFSRDDLFAAIVDPGRDVAPLYQTTQVETAGGRVYHGLIVYESPEGTLIQTAPDVTIRIAGDEIISMRKSRQSLMPTGLLDQSDDQELADLYAWMRGLKGT